MIKYAYYPGCSLHSVAKEYDRSMQAVCKALHVKLMEIPDWICCGSTPAHTTSHLLSVALPIANCTWAEAQGLDIIAPCASCFSRLKTANQEIKSDESLRKTINSITETEYYGRPEVISPLNLFNRLDILARIKNYIKRPLTGLTVACYYGCLLSRPKEISEEYNSEMPVKMDRVISALGASVCNWQYKTECCGAGLAVTQPNVALRLTLEILKNAKENNADLIAVACPLCQSNLDMRQDEISKALDYNIEIPIIYFTQLIGLSLGIETGVLGFEHLITSPFQVLGKKLGLEPAHL